MKLLYKKVTVLAVVCILTAVLLAGCDSGLQNFDEVDSMEINGWSLSSPEGEEAIKNYSAAEVEAVKTLEFDGKLYVCTIKGNAVSVLDRVRDPLFGCADVNYEDPDVKDYLNSFTSKSVTNVNKKHINIEMKPAEGSIDTTDIKESFPVYSGMPPFIFGVACGEISCELFPLSSYMQFSANLMCRSCNSSESWNYVRASDQIFSGMGSVTLDSGWSFGWKQWQINFSVFSGGLVSLEFEWYGAGPKK